MYIKILDIINLQVGQRFIFKSGIKILLEEMNFMAMAFAMYQLLQACTRLSAQLGGPRGVSENKCHSIFWEEDHS